MPSSNEPDNSGHQSTEQPTHDDASTITPGDTHTTQNTRPDNTTASSNTGNQSSHHSVNTDTTTVNHNQDNHASEHPVNTAAPQYSSDENNGVTYGELSAIRNNKLTVIMGDTRVCESF
ncbi:Uncharacterised protein [Staphylococcus gallinarum]|uniref:Uncharacterized protein n=1 Tax=Staphylococcus gallinarum TaxID=1293 RepID=A0A380FKK1_STAGA|nr:Uncharacterised protein [Staphylococcus gallinarum]